MRYNYYVNTTKYDFKERKMFCKHCGKNIYDLEKCPFCNDGEKLDGQASEKTVDTEKPKNTEAVKESAVTPQAPADAMAAKEEVQKGPFINPFEPTEETEGFRKRLKRESKLYKVEEILGAAVIGTLIGGFLLFIIGSFFVNSIAADGFFGVILKGIFAYAPFIYAGVVLFISFEVAEMIIYSVLAKKKNATNKELFADVLYPEAKDYDYANTNVAWDVISLRYGKRYFVNHIILMAIRLFEATVIFVFGTWMLSIAIANFGNGLSAIAKAAIVSIPGCVLILNELVVEGIVVRVLDATMKGRRKGFAISLRNGELENVNQENKNEQ